jgi:hypothetical protein
MLQGFGRVTRVDRSRRARLRRQRKRQRAGMIAGGAALVIALSTSAFSDNKFIAAEEDAGTLLAARSPGERPVGALTSSKPRPRAYALPKTRVRQPADPVFPAMAQLPVSALGQGALISPAALPLDVAPVQLAGISNIPGVTGVPVIIARPPAVATPAVPEPSTWAAMVLGFGAVGMMIRRGKRRSVQLLQPGQGHGG